MTYFTHSGSWDYSSRQIPAINFLEKYTAITDSGDLTQTPSSAYYSPIAIFRDTKGDIYIGGDQIWDWMKRLFSPFEEIRSDVVELRVISDAEGKDVVYAEFRTHFWIRGEEDELQAPMLFVFTIGRAEQGMGTDGLWFEEVRLFWDTGIIGRFVSERKKRNEMVARMKDVLEDGAASRIEVK